MNVSRTTRLGVFLLLGWSFAAAVPAAAPVKLNSPLGMRQNVKYQTFSPDGSRVLYLADQDQDEVYEIYSVPSAGGPPTKLNVPLTGSRDVLADGLQFSPDGSRVLYQANQDSISFFEIYTVPAVGGTPVKLNGPLSPGGAVSAEGLQFSPDGQSVLYRAKSGITLPYELYLVPSAGGSPVKINGTLTNGGNVSPLGLQFSPDGSRVVYRADQDMDEVQEIYARVVRQHWSGGSSDWNVAANWDQSQAPDDVMQIVIDQPGLVTLSANATVSQLIVGGGAGTSTFALETGATLSAVNGLAVHSGGIVRGQGIIQAEVLVEPGGMLAPGSSEGILEVESLTMGADSMLHIEIAGDTVGVGYDQLLVSHDATIAGLLSAELSSAFVPSANDTFTILAAETLEGAFSNVGSGGRLTTLGGEGSFLVNYDMMTNSVTLSDFLSSVGLLGDFNGDDVIDAADYTVWRDAMTAGATTLANDPTPGTVDESDFLYWRDHFGASLGGGAAAGTAGTAVPEPMSQSLALFAGTCLLYWASVRRGVV